MCYRCEKMKERSGYKGQKYAVFAKREDGSETKLGWQNSEDLSKWNALAKAWLLTDLRLEEVKHEAEGSDRRSQ